MPEQKPNQPSDEQRFAELLSALDHDAPPVDHDLLAELRERSAEAVANRAPHDTPQPRQRWMSSLLAAGSAVAATAAAILWAVFPGSASPDASFSRVLSQVAQADTLQLELQHNGANERLWVKPPAKAVRWERAGDRYAIVQGNTQWDVDEAANRAAEQPSLLFPASLPGIDWFTLLMVPSDVPREGFLGSAPVEQLQREGQLLDLYRWQVPSHQESYVVEAWVDAKTHRLKSLESATLTNGKRRPLATLSVVSVNQPLNEDLFTVGKHLTQDGRIGKIVDTQGIVTIRPVLHSRWTPVDRQVLLRPGDWVRTDVRGANAATLRLASGARITLGPGTLAELNTPSSVRLIRGEAQAIADENAPLELSGAGSPTQQVTGKGLFRAAEDKLARLTQTPRWLAGFEGTTSNQSIGSLVTKVDGRNVPLSVGHHSVRVDIRDQIARTVIEESFVNHTGARLEGVFYFPLPQDASISGFGMWIGNQLVEADIVEKQRAREIYETILRERRDPGLLEWTGGNLFKARVFPILPHSEKRVKISYTQVLPLRAGKYRYNYALQSDLLKQHPLRELRIDLRINSTARIAGVQSPTHPGSRIESTPNSAHVEFSAQQHTPDRDFEVVVTADNSQPNVVLIPHRRGEDGYFMLMLEPPESEGQWQRSVVADGNPLDLLVLADTSASMSAESRAAQAEFVGTLLSSLGPADRFNLATCDLGCDWVFAESLPATATNVDAARDRLAARESLGWTDLDAGFKSALARAGDRSQVIYVGDGIPTTRDADPIEFARRLRLLCKEQRVPMHAVATSSSFEPQVLRAIASQGGGSLRRITGESTPHTAAAELLDEIARPSLRNLRIEFDGIQTARVYPQQLPNLPAGRQQIVLGRYLPQAGDQQGQVVVTGMLAGEPVRYQTQVTLTNVPEAADADADSSFIPRLWARMHRDALLEQGGSQAIQDQVVALSEEYHIMTPYTSLLVLETDEDRKRFKVKRHFQMRDAQRFFAEGRDNANHDLLTQQMRRAGTWRLGLRRQALAELMRMGRNAESLLPARPETRWGWGIHSRSSSRTAGGNAWRLSSSDNRSVLFGGVKQAITRQGDFSAPASGPIGRSRQVMAGTDFEYSSFASDGIRLSSSTAVPWEELSRETPHDAWNAPSRHSLFATIDQSFSGPTDRIGQAPRSFFSTSDELFATTIQPGVGQRRLSRGLGLAGVLDLKQAGERFQDFAMLSTPQQTGWLVALFPALPAPPAEPKSTKQPTPWPDSARQLSSVLLRSDALAQLDGGLRIRREVETYDTHWAKLASRRTALELVSPTGWLTQNQGAGSDTLVHWCNQQTRGGYSRAFQLGRRRDSTAADLSHPPLGLPAHMLAPLAQSYAHYTARVEPADDGRKLLLLSSPKNPAYEVRYLIDPARGLVESVETRQDGKITSSTRYDEFVQVAGAWWPARTQTFDNQDRRASVTTDQFSQLASDAFQAGVESVLADLDDVELLTAPLPHLPAARRALLADKTTFSDRIALLASHCQRGDWDHAIEQLRSAEEIAAGKPGVRWLRDAVLKSSRDHQQLKERLMTAAAALATKPAAEDLYLANYLVGHAAGVLADNETLTLLDTLEPVYQRQPDHAAAMRSWLRSRVNHLRNVARSSEADAILAQLAKDYPHDLQAQLDYARALFDASEHEQAFAWLDRVITDEARWRTADDQRLREAYADFLDTLGRWDDSSEYLARWVERNPEGARAYERRLTSLLRLDELEKMNALIEQWLVAARQESRLPPAALSRLRAAVSQALGRGYQIRSNRMDERRLAPLADTVRYFAQHESHAAIAEQIMNDRNFRSSDQCRVLRSEFLRVLRDNLADLSPAELGRLIGWVLANDPAVENHVWEPIADAIQQRWANESDEEARTRLAQSLSRVLSARFPDQHVAFLRRQLAAAPEDQQAAYAGELFNTLLGRGWSAELENEAIGLLAQLSDRSTEPAQRLATEVSALHRLTDRMVPARLDARMAEVEHQQRLTRTELREKKAENLSLARKGLADSLLQATQDLPERLHDWLAIERLHLETLVGDNLDQVAQEAWEYVESHQLPDEGGAEVGPDAESRAAHKLDNMLYTRHLLTLANLAARSNAQPELAERLLATVDTAIADSEDTEIAWRYFKYQLLVALDQPQRLEECLRDWLRADDPLHLWRVSLAYLLAEQGKLKEAAALLDAVHADGQLGASEFRTLANWRLVLGERERHEQAMLEVYAAAPEWQLQNWLWQQLRPWQGNSGPTPGALDRSVMQAFAALLKKSPAPQNHTSQLREFYRTTRDFRLLSGLADAMVGHTAERVYPLLASLDPLFGEVRDEATVDSLVKAIEEVRRRAESPLDRRALDLLEAIVERRASMLLNQPAPHAEKALTVLRRAFRHDWAPGEQRLMSDLLAGFGTVRDDSFGQEQLRQLRALHGGAEAGSADRMHIASSLARCLWGYGDRQQATDLLSAALGEFRNAQHGVLPSEANGPLDTFVSYLDVEGLHTRAEQVLLEEIKNPVNTQQKLWLRVRLYNTYYRTLADDGTVSLGSGGQLFKALQQEFRQDLDTTDHNHRRALVEEICNIYTIASEKNLEGCKEDLKEFAYKQMPAVLRVQTNNYQHLVRRVADTMKSIIGPGEGLRFYITCLENEPTWFRYTYQDGWQQFGWQLARWRKEAHDAGQFHGDLGPRLLALVLRELRTDLETRTQTSRYLYHRSHNGSYYWASKEALFEHEAEQVYRERKSSGKAVQYIADYLYHGVDNQSRAIAILFTAHRAGLLDEAGQATLARYLHEQRRHGESVALLEPLVQLRPDNMDYRTRLMHAYFRTQRTDDLLALLQETDQYFHQQDRWREGAIAALAYCCLENSLFQQSAAYYEEVIPLRQRSQPNRGVGEGTLSGYYANQARAYAGLGDTAKAVDAGCGAIVSWGPTHNNRRHAIQSLHDILARSKDLDGYVALLEQEVSNTGLDNPIVRKQLGRVYSEKQEYQKAITQLALARASRPNDAETHQLLVECYDKQQDAEGAIEQLLRSAELSRRDIALYRDLAHRYRGMGNLVASERAFTSIVEVQPNEAESHAALAEIRQEQDRWGEAIDHWRRVSELRRLEPTGLLRLAAAQVHQQQWQAARDTLRRLESTAWPSRFSTVEHDTRVLQQQIEQAQ